MNVVDIKTRDAIDLKDDTHFYACNLDGLITCAQMMQDELWKTARSSVGRANAETFNEALTVALACMREQVSALKKLAD